MKLTKLLSVFVFITLCSTFYVHLQTEIFHTAYVGQKQFRAFQDSLDKNNILRYNLNSHTSLILIDNKVSEYASFEMPDSYHLVSLMHPRDTLKIATQASDLERKNIVSLIFEVKRRAEAKTINASAAFRVDGQRD